MSVAVATVESGGMTNGGEVDLDAILHYAPRSFLTQDYGPCHRQEV